MISLGGVSKVYEGAYEVHALRDVHLEIEAGEYVAVMGPSGSGKSTLMNIIGCLDRPTSGSYVLDGREVAGLSDDQLAQVRNQVIGFVFQTFNLLARQTALRNVELPMVYRGASPAERRRRALEVLEQVGLADRVHHRPTQLSGGQQQRVAVARALVGQPAFVLADEPTGNLDSRSGQEVMTIFGRLNRAGITILLVTHDERIAAHAKRVIRLMDGRIVSDERNPEPLDPETELQRLVSQPAAGAVASAGAGGGSA